MSKKIVTLGEILLRFTPEGNKRFTQSDKFNVTYGGSEVNVALSLSNFGHDTTIISKVPDNELGKAAINEFSKFGVDTSNIKKGGERLGVYYVENGAALRPSKVIYDRKNSAFSKAKAEEFDFDNIMKGADLFHWCGITPALSPEMAKITELACKAAKKNGVIVSCDLNYRAKLWTPEEAQKVIIPLMKYVDVCFSNEDDALNSLGYAPSPEIKALAPEESYKKQFETLTSLYGFKTIVSVDQIIYSASKQSWIGMIYSNNKFASSRKITVDPMIDGIGGGDAFAAGLIHAFLTDKNLEDSINFAITAGILIYTINGDGNHVSLEEVESIAGGNTSGRVQR